MTSDHFLKFPDQPTALEVLRSLGMTYTTEATEDSEPTEQFSQGGHQWALWVVDSIEGVEGFHVNLRVIDPELDVSMLEEYAVTPRNPRCVWA
jgi:hypothetical protein